MTDKKNKTVLTFFLFIIIGLIVSALSLWLFSYFLTKNDADFSAYKYCLFISVITGTLLPSLAGSIKIKNKRFISALIISVSISLIFFIAVLTVNSFSFNLNYLIILGCGLASGSISGLISARLKK